MTRPPRLQNGPFSWCRLLPGRSIAMLIRPMVKVSFCSFCHPSLFFSPTHPPPPCSTHNTKSTMLQGSAQSHITQSTLCCISYWLRTHHTNCTILYNIVHTYNQIQWLAHTRSRSLVPPTQYPPLCPTHPAQNTSTSTPQQPPPLTSAWISPMFHGCSILHIGKPHTGDMCEDLHKPGCLTIKRFWGHICSKIKTQYLVFMFIITHNCKVIVTIQISIIIISSRRVVRKAEIAPVWGRNTLKILIELQRTKFCPSLVWPCCQTLEGCGSKSCHSVMGPIFFN